jgi:hypothetical protein
MMFLAMNMLWNTLLGLTYALLLIPFFFFKSVAQYLPKHLLLVNTIQLSASMSLTFLDSIEK